MKTYYEYHIASNTLVRLGGFESAHEAVVAAKMAKPTLIFDHEELQQLRMQINHLIPEPVFEPHHIAATEETVRQFYIDVMTTAVEGGIDYWAGTKKVERDTEQDVVSFFARDYDFADSEWKECNVDKVRDAINAIIFEKVDVSDYCREAIADAFTTLDAGEIDVELADVIVQVALFGEVVYG